MLVCRHDCILLYYITKIRPPSTSAENHEKHGIRPARKGPDSIRAGIDFLQDYEIIVHPRCVNFLTEINAYMWDTDKYDNRLNKPQDYMNHLMDAMRYAVEDIAKGDIFSFN